MSILIKGIDMPRNCDDCRLGIDCAYDESQDGYKMMGGRPHNCPLVPVPPHGRLMDAEAFAAEMKMRQEEAGKWLREAKDRETAVRADAVLSFLCEVKLTLDAAHTVIPASKEGE